MVLLGDGREGAGPCGELPGPRVGEIGVLLGGDRRGGAGPGGALPEPQVGEPVVVREHTVTVH